MRRLVAAVLVVLGALAAVAGGAAAAYLDPGDLVMGRPSTVPLQGGRAVLSGRGILSFRDTTLVVRVTNPGGEVFLGRAHPVDADDYVARTKRLVITSVTATSASGVVMGEGDRLAEPGRVDIWTDQASGAGTRSLRMRLDGTPTAYVVVPTGGSGSVEMQSGVVVPGAMRLALVVLAVGLLGIVAGVLLLVLGRRRGPVEPPATPEATPPLPVRSESPGP